jgi:hypothetical protein
VGAEAATRHPGAALGFVWILHVLLISAACYQASNVWRGGLSVVAFSVGAAFSLVLLGFAQRARRGAASLPSGLVNANVYAGLVFGVILVTAARIGHLSPPLDTIVEVGDGYVVVLFAGLLLFTHRPQRAAE